MKVFLLFIALFIIYSNCNEECNQLMLDYLRNFNPMNFSNPVVSSGTGYNDFGKYDLCIENKFKYYLYQINFEVPTDKLVPSFHAFIGLCIPPICYNETTFEYWKELAESYLKLPKDNMTVIKTVEENDKYSDIHISGFIILILIGVFILLSSGLLKCFLDWFNGNEDDKIEVEESQRLSTNEERKSDINDSNDKINNSVEINRVSFPQNQEKEVVKNNAIKKGIFKNLFDIQFNYNRMFDLPKDKNIKAIYGIKTFTMIFIMYLSMIMTFTTYPIPIRNPEGTLEYVRSFIWQIFFGNTYCYDIFFFISAFYLSYKFSNKKQSEFKFYIYKILHKFLRWYPVYLIVFAIYYKFLIKTLDGPVSGHLFNNEIESCQKYYPFILGLLQDLTLGVFNGDKLNPNYICYNWTWFSCNLFHFYIIGCILMYIYSKNSKNFYIICLSLLGICTGLEIFIFINKDYGMTYYELHMKNYNQYFTNYYSKIYMRAPTYLIGLLFGVYYSNKIKDENSSIYALKDKKCLKFIFYYLGLLIDLYLIFVSYFAYSTKNSIMLNNVNLFVRVLYNVLSRKLFIIGFFFLILPFLQNCYYYLGGFVNDDCYSFLNKILFTSYLINPLLIRFVLLNARYQLYFDGWYILFYGTSCVTISFILGFIFTLLFEIPMDNTKIYLFDDKEIKKYSKLNEEIKNA